MEKKHYKECSVVSIGKEVYILGDEEIKKGDWFYSERHNLIAQVKSIEKDRIILDRDYGFDGYIMTWTSPKPKKVLACTDKSLTVFKPHADCNGIGCDKCMKHQLPSIPNDFIQAYIKAQGKMEKVLVEMNNVCLGNCASTYPLSVQCTKPNNCHFPLKLSSDNTITIIPFEEKKQNFTREEFKQALELLYFQKGGGYEDEFNEWFDKNY